MGLLKRIFGADIQDIVSTEIKSIVSLQTGITSNNITTKLTPIGTQIFPSWQVFRDIETYRIVDEISSVVNKLAKTAAMIPLFAYDATGQDLPVNNKLVAFLNKFTYSQRLELFSYLILSEEAFVYKQKVDLGPNAGVISQHVLHPNFMTIVLTREFPAKITGYIYRDPQTNEIQTFRDDEIIFIRGWNPSIDFYFRWRGMSKVDLLTKRLTRLESNKANSVAQMQNGGVPGILWDKDGDFDQIEKKGLRDSKLLSFFTNPENKGLPYTAAGDIGYVALGSSLVDLDSAHLAEIDLKGICNAWGLSAELMNIDSTVRSDVKTTVAQMYTNAVQPYLTLVEEAYTRDIIPEFNESGFIKFDLSNISVLQESILEKIKAAAEAPTFIPNDVRELQGLDRLPDPAMEKVYIKSIYVPLDELSMDIPPVDPNISG